MGCCQSSQNGGLIGPDGQLLDNNEISTHDVNQGVAGQHRGAKDENRAFEHSGSGYNN